MKFITKYSVGVFFLVIVVLTQIIFHRNNIIVIIKQRILLPFAKYHIFQIRTNTQECDKFEEIQERRRNKIREVCKKYNLATGVVNMNNLNLNVDVKEKFIFCKNLKVASRNWRAAIAYLNGNVPSQAIKQLRGTLEKMIKNGVKENFYKLIQNFERNMMRIFPYRQIPENRWKHLLRHTFKFTCVRNPFERLLSAWRYKFVEFNPFNEVMFKRYGKRAIRKFRPNASQESLNTGRNVTFKEFLQIVILEGRKDRFDDHWKPYYKACQFCDIDYHAIVKLENIASEGPIVLKMLAGSTTVKKEAIEQFPTEEYRSSYTGSEVKKKRMEKLYRDIPVDIMDQIRELYSVDFEMFEYDKYLEITRKSS